MSEKNDRKKLLDVLVEDVKETRKTVEAMRDFLDKNPGSLYADETVKKLDNAIAKITELEDEIKNLKKPKKKEESLDDIFK